MATNAPAIASLRLFSVLAFLLALWPRIASAQPGDLDLSFGRNGSRMLLPRYRFTSIALQPDGRILLAGNTRFMPRKRSVSTAKAALWRLDSDGRTDASFHYGHAQVVVPCHVGDPDVEDCVESAFDATQVLPDGRIVAVGYTDIDTLHKVFAAARFTPEGKLDPSFGDGGTSVLGVLDPNALIFNGEAHALAVQDDGKLLLGGDSNRGPDLTHQLFRLMRADEHGRLDASFGGTGIVDIVIANNWESIDALFLLDETKILAVGHSALQNFEGDTLETGIAMARYNSDGSLDTGFGDNGRRYYRLGTDLVISFFPYPVIAARTADGKILTLINYPPGTNCPAGCFVKRFDADGNLDLTFGDGGTVTVGDITHSPVSAMTLDGDGSIVLGGWTVGSANVSATLERLTPDGTVDSRFGRDGFADIDLGPAPEIVNGLAVRSDGTLLAVGDIVFWPFLRKPKPEQSFTFAILGQ